MGVLDGGISYFHYLYTTKRQDMLLPDMTLQEVKEEYKRDWKNVIENEFKVCAQFGSVVKKSSFRQKYPLTRMYTAITKERKNKIHYMVTALKRSEWNNPLVVSYMIWDTPRGKHAVMPVEIANGRYEAIVIITPHCFHRYRERFLKDEDLTNEEVINLFMKTNSRWFGLYINNDLCTGSPELEGMDVNKKKRAQVTFQGVGFSEEIEEDLVIMKTFVSYDMLFPKQAEILLPYKEQMFDGKEHAEYVTGTVGNMSYITFKK